MAIKPSVLKRVKVISIYENLCRNTYFMRLLQGLLFVL